MYVCMYVSNFSIAPFQGKPLLAALYNIMLLKKLDPTNKNYMLFEIDEFLDFF